MGRGGAGAPTMRRNIRELPSVIWILVAGVFINRFASFAAVFLVLFLTDHGFGIAQAGAAIAAYGLGAMAASPLGGHLADRLGRRATIALSMYLSAGAVLALYEVRAFTAVLVTVFLAGLAIEIHRPAALALVADVVPSGARVTAYAVVRLAANLGFALGAVVAGILARSGFLWVFLSDAATSAAFGTMALAFLPRGLAAHPAERARAWGYRRALLDPALLILLAASFLVAFVYSQADSTLPLYVIAQPGLAVEDFGMLLALNGLLVAAFELPLSSITMRLPARRSLAASFALVGLGFALTAWAHSLVALMAAVAIWTVGEMIGLPVGIAHVADIAPEDMRGRYQGIYWLVLSAGSVSGPAVGALVFTRTPAGLWLLCGLLGAVAAVLILGLRPAAMTTAQGRMDRASAGAPSLPGPDR